MQSFKTALKWTALGVLGLSIIYVILRPATIEITYRDNADKLITFQVIEKSIIFSATHGIANSDKIILDNTKFIVICNNGNIVHPDGELADDPIPCRTQSVKNTQTYPQIIRPKLEHGDSNIYHIFRATKKEDGKTLLILEEPRIDTTSPESFTRVEDMVVMPVEAGFFCDRLEKDLDEHSDKELYDIVTLEKSKYPAIYGDIKPNPSKRTIEFEATLVRLKCLHRESQILKGLPILESPTSSPVYLRPTDVHLVVHQPPPPPTWIILGGIIILLLAFISIAAAALAVIRKLRSMSSFAKD